MYKVQAEGGNQLSADHKQILLRGWGGFPPISATTKNGGISVNGVFEHFPYTGAQRGLTQWRAAR